MCFAVAVVTTRARMVQRLTSLDEAATQLGISTDRLNALRESGKVRAYKDGASWKFRREDIEKFAAEGVPSIEASPSDLALDLDDEDDDFKFPADSSGALKSAPSSEPELDLSDEERLPKPDNDPAPRTGTGTVSAVSDLSLESEEM